MGDYFNLLIINARRFGYFNKALWRQIHQFWVRLFEINVNMVVNLRAIDKSFSNFAQALVLQ
ncbi:hypothetical protein ACE1CI_04305 [Aerosakkonemataceae cyanobacterium BLCC-F50]|uniref:Uncharacterized protein n=1 Tax=Floridaenema flaviceps BLCC-F50 TaxID=3153642 RepID=A0ABV4XKA8_9CYAN